MLYYVYVIESEMNGFRYTGFTSDLQRRLGEHNSNITWSTSLKGPFKLIYYEACLNKEDALRREKYMKSGNGKIYLNNRLGSYYSASGIIDLKRID